MERVSLLEKLLDFLSNVFPPGKLSPTRSEILSLAEQEHLPKSIVKEALKVLLRAGFIKRKGRRYVVSKKMVLDRGSVEVEGEDLFVTIGARKVPLEVPENVLIQEGDVVAVVTRASSRRRRRAVYLWHLKRSNPQIIGVLKRRKKAFLLHIPGTRIFLPLSQWPRGLKEGDVVRVTLEDRPLESLGHVEEVIAKGGGREAEIRFIIGKSGAPMEHPPEIEQEAERVVFKPHPTVREDLRDLPFITLDVDDAKDHDDAICLIKHKDGYVLYVAIADVTAYVRPGSPLDREALRRGFTIYYPGGFFPMFPRKLTQEILSLQPGKDRFVLVVEIGLNPEGQRRYYSIYPAVIRSRAKLFYGEITQFLHGLRELHSGQEEMLFEMHLLARRLRDMRRARGSLDFDLSEQFFVFEGPHLLTIERKRAEEASKIVEEFMLLANETVARHISQEGVPSIYRVHPPPDDRDLAQLKRTLENYGIRLKGPILREELAGIIDLIRGTAYERVILFNILRALKLAYYSPYPGEHFGLALDVYTHFTSPIRRYPDVIVHRVVKQVIEADDAPPLEEGLSLEEVADRLSLLERRAEEIEREIAKFVSADFMKDKVGEKFRGFVSGVIEGGAFVEIESPFVEGFAPRRLVKGGPYVFDRRRGVLKARSGRSLKPGMEVEVEVVRVSPSKRQIDLKITSIKDKKAD